MAYQVLARKWRPQDLASVVGQEPVVTSGRERLDTLLDVERLLPSAHLLVHLAKAMPSTEIIWITLHQLHQRPLGAIDQARLLEVEPE